MCPVQIIQSLSIRERREAHGHSLTFPYGEGKVIHMKKRLFLILFVAFMFAAGCGNQDNIVTDRKAEATETGTKEPDRVEKKENSAVDGTESEKEKREQIKEETPKETEPEKGHEEEEKAPESQSAGQPEQKEETEAEQNSADMSEPKEIKPEDSQTEESEETKPEEPQAEEPKEITPEDSQTDEPQEQAVAAYNPVSVCSMAIAKCQAGGMITTTDNLANLLSEGKITQEEYDSYYPYDGLGYYSVFVETDLNRASTTSGRKLGSEGEIADYIAGMMLLETEPVFYIEYAGAYNQSGTEFYEFRCYR